MNIIQLFTAIYRKIVWRGNAEVWVSLVVVVVSDVLEVLNEHAHYQNSMEREKGGRSMVCFCNWICERVIIARGVWN